MITFSIKLADIVISVNAIYDTTKQFCHDYITKDSNVAFSVVLTQDDITFERNKSYSADDYHDIARRNFDDSYLEKLALYRKIVIRLLDYNVFLMHGCVIAVNDEAYLFTATSGTGKTTHCKLWLKNIPRSYILNGDKPLIKVENSHVYIYGTPWQGKENYGINSKASLKGICILERNINNSIHKLSALESMPIIIQQTYRPNDKEAMSKTLTLINELLAITGVYKLKCNISDEAALLAYESMKQENSL